MAKAFMLNKPQGMGGLPWKKGYQNKTRIKLCSADAFQMAAENVLENHQAVLGEFFGKCQLTGTSSQDQPCSDIKVQESPKWQEHKWLRRPAQSCALTKTNPNTAWRLSTHPGSPVPVWLIWHPFLLPSSLQRKVTLGEAQLKLGLTAITKIFCRNRFVTPWITLENSAGRS